MQGVATMLVAGCDEVQQGGKTHVLFGPLPSLMLESLLNGVISGAGRHGWATHRGRAAVLGVW